MEEQVFQAIERKKISLQIVEQIQELITSGKLKVGECLPPERKLMKVFSVSRPTLREALNMLATMGYIEQAERQRTKVKSLIPGSITDPMQMMLKENAHTALELIEARSIIEIGNARLAAIRATDEDIVALEKCIEDIRSKQGKYPGLTDADADFHQTIARATHNNTLAHLMYSIYHLLKEKVVFCYYTEHTDYIFSQHCDIVDAIKLRDEQQAAEAMEAHLAFIKKLLLEKLNSEKQ